jgi:hypothetical protein
VVVRIWPVAVLVVSQCAGAGGDQRVAKVEADADAFDQRAARRGGQADIGPAQPQAKGTAATSTGERNEQLHQEPVAHRPAGTTIGFGARTGCGRQATAVMSSSCRH